MGTVNTSIAEVPRLCFFPWKVTLLSRTENSTTALHESVYQGKMGFCIRLFSAQEYAFDTINGIEYRSHFPNVMLKKPNIRHCLSFSETRRTFEFQYSEETMHSLLRGLPFPIEPIWETRFDESESRMINELMQLMEHTMEYGVADRIDILAFALMESLLLHRGNAKFDPARDRIMSVVSYFNLHFADDFNWNKLLYSHGLSRSTFERHWRNYFDITPGQYLQKLRLEEAARMLKEMPNLSVADIAEKLNFAETNYFCGVFKKFFGKTPLQFKKQLG